MSPCLLQESPRSSTLLGSQNQGSAHKDHRQERTNCGCRQEAWIDQLNHVSIQRCIISTFSSSVAAVHIIAEPLLTAPLSTRIAYWACIVEPPLQQPDSHGWDRWTIRAFEQAAQLTNVDHVLCSHLTCCWNFYKEDHLGRLMLSSATCW